MAVSRAVTDGILRRLAKSQAGNALALVAAGLIPLIGLIGGGVDMSRIYLTKARLQQACDAGALTGRKTMGASSWSASNYAARTAANTMFAANFKTGAYGTSGLTNSYSESSGKVTGTASVVLPMSLMKIFGQSTKTITVNCDAEMRIPNTDVMFVLDTTGSMGDTNVGDTDTKMNGLKKAVKCFYEALAKIDTAADCGSVPTTSNSSTVQLRFGFMPYATDVNVGKLLKNDWIADSWPYQTRVANFTTTTTPGATTQGTATVTSDTFGSYGSWSSQSLYGYYNGYCGGYWNTTTSSGGSEGAAYNQQSTTSGNTTTVTWSTNTTVTQYEYTESNYTYGGNRYCLVYVRNRSAVETKQYSRTDTTSAPTTSTAFSDWTYDQHSWDISSLKAGNDTWNSSVSLPVGTNGASKSISWDGCIEERQTVRTTDFSPIPTDAYDLEIGRAHV